MLASITLELWETIKKDLGYNASGPEVFCAITQNQQLVNFSAVRALFQALKKMRLTDKPGQDVGTLGNKMEKMAHQISITVSTPIELSTLLATVFTY